MVKKIIRRSLPYLFFCVILIDAIKHGFSVLFYISAALMCILLVLDLISLIRRR